MPKNDTLTLEKLAKSISVEVSRVGEVEVDYSCSVVNSHSDGSKRVRRTYSFSKDVFEDYCSYDNAREVADEAHNDGINALQYFVRPLVVREERSRGNSMVLKVRTV